jgi:S-adenosylmethionine:tRNA ribosyltransferase-isomerase
MLRTADLDYVLPPGLIATEPVEPRDSARLMVVRGASPPEHARVSDLPALLRAGDLLVVNTSRVAPARFAGRREDTGARVAGLLLDAPSPGRWIVLLRTRRPRAVCTIALHDAAGRSTGVRLTTVARIEPEVGAWEVEARDAAGPIACERLPALLARIGLTPLPPYILAARKARGEVVPDALDRERYQTVYASAGEGSGGEPALPASVAAPTAGLHFTPGLLDRLAAAGVGRAEVVLHVGAGTFAEVRTEEIDRHPMHAEWYRVGSQTLLAVEHARSGGGRVIAVGTTAARALEACAADVEAGLEPGAWRSTRLLIVPGHPWRLVDGLLTNFHLPRSTLMALVAGIVPGGVPRLLDLYAHAIAGRYRFYSYGDAMLILP